MLPIGWRDAFASEIRRMQQGMRRLNIELAATAGEYGSSYYRVQIVGATKATIESVVSEGEHQCIALAGFLSELATEDCQSAIVFDDPVTSLAHNWRDASRVGSKSEWCCFSSKTSWKSRRLLTGSTSGGRRSWRSFGNRIDDSERSCPTVARGGLG